MRLIRSVAAPAVLVFVVMGSGWAQEAGPPTPVTPPVTDYGSAFQLFHRLGLPVVPADATYVTLNAYSSEDTYRQPSWLDRIELRNRAWMLPGEGLKRSFVTLGGRTMDVYDAEALRKAEMEAVKAAGNDEAPQASWHEARLRYTDALQGTWKPADQAADVKKLADSLMKRGANAEGEPWDRELGQYFSRGYASSGPVLLAAAQYYSQAFTNAGNEIAGALFAMTQDRRKVVMQAVTALAEAQYAMAMDAFAATGDWSGLRTSLLSVQQRFKTAWVKAPGVALLVEKITARMTGTPPPVQGEGLTDEDQTLAAALANLTRSNITARAGFLDPVTLTLNPALQRRLATRADSDPLTRIRLRGLRAIPMLAALLGDAWMLPMTDLALGGREMFDGRGRWDMDEMDDSRDAVLSPEDLYNTLRRPMTRGALAMQLLLPLLPRGDEDLGMDQPTPELIAMRARAFYREHGTKSPFDLTCVYLKDGGYQQRGVAARMLTRSHDPKAAAVLEAYLLEPDEEGRLNNKVELVVQYATAQGTNALPLVATFKAKLAEEYERQLKESRRSRDRKDMERWQNQMLQRLDQATATRTFAQALAAMDAGAMDAGAFESSLGTLYSRMAQETPSNVVRQVLSAAVATDNPTNRVALLHLVSGVAHRLRMPASRGPVYDRGLGMDVFDDEMFYDEAYAGDVMDCDLVMVGEEALSDEAAVVPPAELDVRDFRELWTTLLDDPRAASPRGRNRGYDPYGGGAPTPRVCDVAAWSLIALAEPTRGDHTAMGQVGQTVTLGARAMPRVHELARAILKGVAVEALPKLPDAMTIDGAARTNLVERLAATSTAKLRAAIDGLSDDELLALGEVAEQFPDLNRHLAEEGHRITKVELGPTVELGAALAACEGQLVSSNVVAVLLDVARDATAKGERVTCRLVRAPWLGGVTVNLAVRAAGDESMDEYGYMFGSGSDGQPMVVGALYGGRIHGNATWVLNTAGAPAKGGSSNDAGATTFLSELGVEMSAQIPAEILAKMQAVMVRSSRGQSDSHAREQQRFWKAVDQFCAATNNVLGQAQVTFVGVIPGAEENDEDASDDEGM